MQNQLGHHTSPTVAPFNAPPPPPTFCSTSKFESEATPRIGEVWSAFFVNCALHADRIGAMRRLREKIVADAFMAVRRDDSTALEDALISFETEFPGHNIPLVEQRPCSGLGQSPRGEKTLTQGRTLLHYAAMLDKQYPAMVLLNHCADLDATDAFGNTPLHLAVRAGKTCQVATLLLGGAAAVDVQNLRGETPVSLARRHGNKEMRTLLREYMPYSQASEDEDEYSDDNDEDEYQFEIRKLSIHQKESDNYDTESREKARISFDHSHYETDGTATFSDCQDHDGFSDCQDSFSDTDFER
jgi:hypothetical protein